MTSKPPATPGRRPLVDALHFYEAVLGAIGQAVIASDIDGLITFWNDAAARLYGWTAEETIGRSLLDIVVPSISRETAVEIFETLREGRRWEGDFPVKRRDGTTFLAHVTDAPMFDAEGNLSGVVGISFDIDAKRHEEEALRESEDRFRSLFEQSPIPTMCWKRVGDTFVLSDMNTALNAYSGSPRSSFLGKSAEDLRQGSSFPEDLERCFLTGEPIESRVRRRVMPNGDVKHFVSTFAFIPPDTVIQHIHDLTQMLGVQEALRASNAMLGAILNASPIPMMALDRNAFIRLWNRAAEKVYGWMADEVIGKVSPLVPEDETDAAFAIFERVIAGETLDGLEVQRRLKDGRLADLRMFASPLHDSSGEVMGVMMMAENVTERNRANAELRARERRQRAIAELGQTALSDATLESLSLQACGVVMSGLNVAACATIGCTSEGKLQTESSFGITPDDVERLGFSRSRIEDRTSSVQSAFDNDTRRVISVPIHAGSQTCGFLEVYRDVDAQFTSHEVEFLRSIANILATASHRKKTEDELADKTTRLRLMLEQMPAIVWSVDPGLTVTSAMGAGLRGDVANDLVGHPLDRLIADSTEPDAVYRAHREALKGNSKGYETQWKGRTLDAHIEPFRNAAGDIVGVLGIGVDVTDRKRFEEQLTRSHEQLRALSSRILSIQEVERQHLAREIHDELGQAMTVLKLGLSWAQKRYRGRDAAERFREMQQIADETIEVVRRMSRQLRPPLLDHLGVRAAIELETEQFQQRTGLRCTTTINAGDAPLDNARSVALFRILQEALTNVVRHAGPCSVEVSLERHQDRIELRVEDDGRGITADQLSNPASLGLIGMRERAHALGGDVAIDLTPLGTTVRAWIPASGPPTKGEHT